MQDANTLIKFVAEEPERNKEFLHVIGKRDCYACLNSLPATSVCETCKKGLIHSHMVHVWGEDGEEVKWKIKEKKKNHVQLKASFFRKNSGSITFIALVSINNVVVLDVSFDLS